ncbi:MAG: hypothetical protein JST23_07160 [Bacteroidetes bacterium]|nr:hypothetical protein [Bacteroidota bacterium]
MKHLILFFLVLFTIKAQTQQQVSPEVSAKMKEMQGMSKKKQEPKGNTNGKIIYTVSGKTYTETKEISTTIIGGQIGDIANANHTVSIGDGELHTFKKGQSYHCKVLMLIVDGLPYSRRSKDNVATITLYDGKIVKGNFSGTVYNEKTKKTLSVSGTFETGNITLL